MKKKSDEQEQTGKKQQRGSDLREEMNKSQEKGEKFRQEKSGADEREVVQPQMKDKKEKKA